MNVTRSNPIPWLAAVLLAGTAWAAELPERDAYAYRFPLTAPGRSEFFSAPVPLDVYRSVTDPQLRDAGVYNADGEPVPRVFERPAGGADEVEQRVPIGLVPLHGTQTGQPEQLRLLLRRDADSTTLELDAPERDAADEAPADGAGPLAAFIAEPGDHELQLTALEFSWPETDRGFMGTVSIEDSADLHGWRNLAVATLADLHYEDTRIRQDRISLSRQPDTYLRITWRDMPGDWTLDGLAGVHARRGAPAARDWLTLEPSAPAEAEREFLFHAGGFPPADRVNVLVPGDNVVVRASIWHRRHDDDRWRRAHTGVFYNISRQGAALRSPAAAVHEARDARWKVRLESGAPPGPVRLELGWRPDRLVFLAQGPGPYELATGRARDRLEQFPQQTVLGDRSIFGMLRDSGTAGEAAIGARALGGGPDRMAVVAEREWRRVLLWIGLVTAIALVGWMVWSLTRQMREEGGGVMR